MLKALKLLTILSLLIFIGEQKAEASLTSPQLYNVEIDRDTLILDFEYPSNDIISGYKLYIADGETNNLEEFELLRIIEHNPFKIKRFKRVSYSIVIDDRPTPGKHTFYLTAYHIPNESDPSDFVTTNIKNTFNITFETTPQKNGFIGEPYIYKAKAVSSDFDPINYKIVAAPKGSSIDSKTGEFIWVPEKLGIYAITIRAYLENDSTIYKDQSWNVQIKECRVGGNIDALVTDEQGNSVEIGLGTLLIKNDTIEKYDEYRFSDGQLLIENIDKGKYYLLVEGESFEAEYYKDAYHLANATPINVDCGKTIEIKIEVKKKNLLKDYKIQGHITDKKDNPVNWASITFYGRNLKTNDPSISRVITNEDGFYSIELPNDKKYVVRAAPPSDTSFTANKELAAIYYEDETDYTEAVRFIPGKDNNTFDFALPEKDKIDNSISGQISDKNNNPLPNVNIVAYPVKTDNIYRDGLFQGLTTVSDKNGNFTFTSLIPGEYVLLGAPNSNRILTGYYSLNEFYSHWNSAAKIDLNYQHIENLHIELLELPLPPAGKAALKGTVIGDKMRTKKIKDKPLSSNIIPGAIVYLKDINDQHRILFSTLTDHNGKYTINNIKQGNYRLTFEKVGYKPVHKDIILSQDTSFANANMELLADPTFNMELSKNFSSNSSVIYPNPANGTINIRLNRVYDKIKLSLTNLIGQEIFSEVYYNNNSNNDIKIDIDSISQGIYVLNLDFGKTKETHTLIIN